MGKNNYIQTLSPTNVTQKDEHLDGVEIMFVEKKFLSPPKYDSYTTSSV